MRVAYQTRLANIEYPLLNATIAQLGGRSNAPDMDGHQLYRGGASTDRQFIRKPQKVWVYFWYRPGLESLVQPSLP